MENKIQVKSLKLVNEQALDMDNKVTNTAKIFECARFLGHNLRGQEYLYLYCLDNCNNINCIALLGIGTTNMINIDFKVIFQYAILSNSSKIIMVHNHPSGSLEPSKEDIKMAKSLYQACNIMGIELLDNIIITENNFVSYQKGVEKNG